ncbi:MAG: sensor protein [Fibrobacteres bacterium]|nr:sensor protein [Fibrobacterota bacterium]
MVRQGTFNPTGRSGLVPGHPKVENSKKPVILLVDDEADVRRFIRTGLENAGYRVLEAEGGKAALLALADMDDPIGVLVTDVLMPYMHGNELLKRARSIRPDLKAVFISGHSRNILNQLTLVPEDAPFLQKPVKTVDLVSAIEAFAAERDHASEKAKRDISYT